MSTPLDTAVMLGVESTYRTPVAPTHALEAKTDPWQREHGYVESAGFRSGMHTLRAKRRKTILLGATGSIELDVMDRGMGVIAQSLLGQTSGPTEGTTGVYTSTHSSDSEPSGISYTVQILRPAVGGALVPFTYHGAVPISWGLSHEVEGVLALNVDFDAADETTDFPAGTPQYTSDAEAFGWHEATITVGGVQVDATAFEFTAELGMKTDRRFIRGSAQKKQPLRNALPVYSGSLTAEFETTDQYDAFVAGVEQPIVATWTGQEIGSTGEFCSVELSLGACQYDNGATPNASLDDVTMQQLPFRVLDDDSGPAVQMAITSDDSAF